MAPRFTERARDVLQFAVLEADQLKNDKVGTEHALLGILREGGGVASRLAGSLQLKLDLVRQGVAMLNPPSACARPPANRLPYGSDLRRAIDAAEATARSLGHAEIGIGHLFLGLIEDPECKAALFLVNLGLDLSKTRQEWKEALAAGRS